MKNNKLLILGGGFAFILLFLLSNVTDAPTLAVISLTVLLLPLAVFCIRDFSKRLGLVFFYVCIFTFLIAGAILPFWMGDSDWMGIFTSEEFIKACNIVAISCVCLAVGFYLSSVCKLTAGSTDNSKRRLIFISDSKLYIKTLQKLVFVLFLLSTGIALFFELEKLIYALNNGYVSLYTSYENTSIIAPRALLVSKACYFIGLAAKPKKQWVYIYIAIGFIIPAFELLQGARSEVMMSILFVIFYFYTYDELRQKLLSDIAKRKKLIKLVAVICVIVFVGLPFLYVYGYTRVGRSYEMSGLVDGVLQFFKHQGGSFELIEYSVRFDGKLPGICYSFGAIIDSVLGNNYEAFTVDAALKTNRFGTVITYLVKQYNYLNLGDGMGSSYMAELFYDFGYIGVAIANLIIGISLRLLTKWERNSIFVQAIFYMIFFYMLTIPRAPLMNPIIQIGSITTITTFAVIFGASYKWGERIFK